MKSFQCFIWFLLLDIAEKVGNTNSSVEYGLVKKDSMCFKITDTKKLRNAEQFKSRGNLM